MDLDKLVSSFQSIISEGLKAALPEAEKEVPAINEAITKEQKIKERDTLNELGLAIKRR